MEVEVQQPEGPVRVSCHPETAIRWQGGASIMRHEDRIIGNGDTRMDAEVPGLHD
jgi:hypothetical protein